jgi:hypothetical protein
MWCGDGGGRSAGGSNGGPALSCRDGSSLGVDGTSRWRRRQARGRVVCRSGRACRMDLPGPTTSVGTRTNYLVGPWDYPACATRHLKA